MGTRLIYNYTSDMYEANLDGHHIEVNPDVYSESVTDYILDHALEQGYSNLTDVHTLPEEEYDRLHDEAECYLLCAEVWDNPPMDGLYIDGVDRSEQ